jgi:hypothetical protein
MTEKAYTLRDLNAQDLFPLADIVSKIGIDEIAKAFGGNEGIMKLFDGNKEDATATVGIAIVLDIANIILKNVGKCEKEIFKFLANVSDMELAKVKKLPMATFAQMIIDVIKKEEFKDFMTAVSGLLK